MTNIQVVVSGSFHRHMSAIYDAVNAFIDLQVKVLSPADPRVVGQIGEFLFVASDSVRSIRMVQDRHNAAIRSADFLWLVSPDGYVGQSASLEIGFATAHDKPVFSLHSPSDLTLRQYVRVVPSIAEALRIVTENQEPVVRKVSSFLINPYESLNEVGSILEQINGEIRRLETKNREGDNQRLYSLLNRANKKLRP